MNNDNDVQSGLAQAGSSVEQGYVQASSAPGFRTEPASAVRPRDVVKNSTTVTQPTAETAIETDEAQRRCATNENLRSLLGGDAAVNAAEANR